MRPKIFTSLLAAAAIAAPHIAIAQEDIGISAEIGANGLAATELRLGALGDADPSERFALGGVRFLLAIEHGLQTLYATDINQGLAEMSGLPVIRLPLPPNPDARAFEPRMIDDMIQEMQRDLMLALAPLEWIGPESDVGVTINTADLWFDINKSGVREPGESVLDLLGPVLTPAWEDPNPVAGITVRFDTADAAWLRAYVHLLSGINDLILSVDTTEAISRVLDARAAMDALSAIPGNGSGFFPTQSIADLVDVVAMFAFAFDQQPDATFTRAARQDFLDMIAENITFWQSVASETDNVREWIPNKTQTSALPIDFPATLGPTWLAVLSDAEKLLNGDLLIPVWRMGDGAGVNLAALMENPPPLDLISVIQGEALLPYLEHGPLISDESLMRLEQLVGGDAWLYMIVLN